MKLKMCIRQRTASQPIPSVLYLTRVSRSDRSEAAGVLTHLLDISFSSVRPFLAMQHAISDGREPESWSA
jgi:hypothetical protein